MMRAKIVEVVVHSLPHLGLLVHEFGTVQYSISWFSTLWGPTRVACWWHLDPNSDRLRVRLVASRLVGLVGP